MHHISKHWTILHFHFQFSISIPPENVRKPLANLWFFWYFQGVKKWKISLKWVNETYIYDYYKVYHGITNSFEKSRFGISGKSFSISPDPIQIPYQLSEKSLLILMHRCVSWSAINNLIGFLMKVSKLLFQEIALTFQNRNFLKIPIV